MSRNKQSRWLLALLSLLTVAGLALPASASAQSASPRTSAAVPDLHDGIACYAVHSQRNWRGTICAMVNYNDLRLDSFAQGLITFSVRSGKIKRAYATNIYLQRCDDEGFCSYTDNRKNPSVRPNAKSTSLADSFIYVGLPPVQDALTSFSRHPCIRWTNGQLACYNGLMRSGTALG
jgi:hypothetical protein